MAKIYDKGQIDKLEIEKSKANEYNTDAIVPQNHTLLYISTSFDEKQRHVLIIK